jgi:site-specific DNA-methyltransferase (adenine-specific)
VRPYYEQDGIVIYNADCREVLPSLRSESVGLVLTDPPYNVTETGARANTTQRTVRRRDGTSRAITQHFGEWDRGWRPDGLLAESSRLLAGGRGLLAFTSDRLIGAYVDGPLNHKRVLVWRKTNPVPSFNRTYPLDSEWIVWQGKGDRGPLYRGGHATTTVFAGPVAPPAPKRHPNAKPEWLLRLLIEMHSEPGDLVLDPFMGAGPVLRVAKDLGRRAIGIENEERWCEVAIRRLAQRVLFGSEDLKEG